jgi:hypothetical protein
VKLLSLPPTREMKEKISVGLKLILLYFENIHKVKSSRNVFDIGSYFDLHFTFLFLSLQNPSEIKYQSVNFFNESFLQKIFFNHGTEAKECIPLLLFYLSFGPAAFRLSPPTSDATAASSWTLVSRFRSLYQDNEQLEKFYSKKYLVDSLKKYCVFLEKVIARLIQ